MRYFNETEKRLAERYHHMELGTCKICEECHKKEHLSLPIGCWCVGSDFNKTSKRILFVGKNARNNPGTIEDGFRNPFQYTRESLWNKSWPYWSYTRAITQRIFGDDSIEHIAFTNIVKCNNSGGKDTTSDFVKSNCILNLKVLQQELKVIHPTHIIFIQLGIMTITYLTFLTVIIFITTVLKTSGKEKCPGRKPFPLWAIKPFMYYVSATHNARKKATSSMKYLSGLSLPYDFMADSRIFSS